MSDSDTSSVYSTYLSDDCDVFSFTSKPYSFIPDDQKEIDASNCPTDVITKSEYDQIISLWTDLEKQHKGDNMFPGTLMRYLTDNYDFIYERLKEMTQDGVGLLYAPGILANILNTTPKPLAPETVLFDVCVFSRPQAVTLLTFVHGKEKSKRANFYNSQISKSMKSLVMQKTHTNNGLVYGVVDIEDCKIPEMYELKLSEMQLSAKLMSISCTSDIQEDKWLEVIHHILDFHLPEPHVTSKPSSKMDDTDAACEVSSPTKRSLSPIPIASATEGKKLKTERDSLNSPEVKEEKMETYSKDDCEEMRGAACHVTSTSERRFLSAIKEEGKVPKTEDDNPKTEEIQNGAGINWEKWQVFFNKDNYKIFNDSVQGNMEIHPLCVKIIDTQQFQRLRQIKQLGTVCYVYPGAVHTRFEHSIGTCYLAETWVMKLIERLPSQTREDISNQDLLCVMIAALCHDLGHGPFGIAVQYNQLKVVGNETTEEENALAERSCQMLDHLLDENDLRPHLKVYGLKNENVADIKKMIKGEVPPSVKGDRRMQHRSFLYEIVKNKRTSIDVDTWESLERNCYHLNNPNSIVSQRFRMVSRVIADNDGRTQICFRDKEIENIYKMFEKNYDLYREAYDHRVAYVIKLMITDALIRASEQITLAGKRKIPLAECVNDMAAFTDLTDSILDRIMTTEDGLQDSKEIISHIYRRKLYPSFHSIDIMIASETALRQKLDNATEEDIATRIMEMANTKQGQTMFKEGELFVEFLRLAYNKTEADLADKVHYYQKKKPTEITTDTGNKRRRLNPGMFQQYRVVVSCRDVHASPEKAEALDKALQQWSEDKRLH